ncbi:MAG: hypothetical protein E6R03_10275 [Hyphomicrobiaceae bacterium]|nr:MAG: hypothetical protein E6R03_10275 [Hyphomicrobiaceae bacterium]
MLKSLKVRTTGGIETTHVGRVVDSSSVTSVKDTVLDPEVMEKGAYIEMPVEVRDISGMRPLKAVYLPRFESEQLGRMIILNEMASAANTLLRVIEDFQKNEATEEVLQTSVDSYHRAAYKMLSGKGGVVGGHILSTRIAQSGRAVLLINGEHDPMYAGLPGRIMRRLKIKPGEPVLIGRDPSIWHGSFEILLARHSGNACIELHPLLFRQLGADCDGDCVYVYKLPTESDECKKEIEDQLLGFTRNDPTYAEWPAYLKTAPGAEKVDWPNVVEETKRRSTVTGFSITPEDVLTKSDKIKKLCALTGKDVVDECEKIARGLTREEIMSYVLDQNATQLRMKLLLGPIGAASNRLKVLAGTDKKLLTSACVLSEWLQQRLLSSKHSVSAGKKEPYSIWDILALVGRRGKYAGATLMDILEEVGKMGMPLTQVTPIITHLWISYPLQQAVDALFKDSDIRDGSARLIRQKIAAINYDASAANDAIDRILYVAKALGMPLTREEIVAKYWECAAGLTDLCAANFPIFEMTGSSATIPLINRVVLHGDMDKTGIGAISMKIAAESKEIVDAVA